MPSEEKAAGKWGQSLTLTIRVSEPKKEDGCEDAVQPKPELYGRIVREVATVEGATVDTSMRVVEDSLPVPQTNEIVLPADETEATGSVLLCVVGFLNGIEVIFLIDSGAN